jgi:hypothetical protein
LLIETPEDREERTNCTRAHPTTIATSEAETNGEPDIPPRPRPAAWVTLFTADDFAAHNIRQRGFRQADVPNETGMYRSQFEENRRGDARPELDKLASCSSTNLNRRG